MPRAIGGHGSPFGRLTQRTIGLVERMDRTAVYGGERQIGLLNT